ncbi:DUF456 domain-containing protein [Flavobacterium branchiophilum]|uniref:DUF456 domain-containing protein n=2 Tax=Flavobacterium branchiophilum TaxID=55197 RepID=G2Z2F1_FLABF|nr:DUF456 domain-containing protein [Flavobacterium branchiophilum]PDS22548.1 DUF456 domain-containing protein [Flavobacterium branchiophilum]CCB70114.1 Protein of unknown function [Flavobacterium branchiophilum FL-15]
MEYVFLILGFICVLIGLFGSFLPALPGPPLSWVGLLLLYFCKGMAYNFWILGITFSIAVAIAVLDYIIPAKGTQYFGGSKYGIWGTNIGIVLGFFIPIPFGFLIAPFIGAFIGELVFNAQDQNRALRAATGSFLGFLAGTFMKIVVSLIFFILYIILVFQNQSVWF